MARVPEWVANTMERVFNGLIRKVQVSKIAYESPYIVKMTFKGSFSNVNFKVGQAISIRVNKTSYRNYTPSYWDSENGVFQVVFHLHGGGPGSSYVSQLQLNDIVTIVLPRGFDVYRAEHKYHFLYGDETSIGLFESMQRVIEENGQEYIGILELNKESTDLKATGTLGLEIVDSSVEKAQKAIVFLDKIPERVWELWKDGAFYLIGNGRAIQKFRTALKDKGVKHKNIKTQPYWIEGKCGL
jgi:NADPH-dependent ferric siderophore reductase